MAYASNKPIRNEQRRTRPERLRWLWAAAALVGERNQVLNLLTYRGFTTRPYLLAHPEREIAEARGSLGLMVCEACDYREVFDSHWTGTGVQHAIAAAHRHNALIHPRRAARLTK